VTNAQALIYTPNNPPTNWFWANNNLGVGTVEPNYYAPFVATTPFPANNFAANHAIAYTGDPGVRNPFLSQGYLSSAVVDPTKANNQPFNANTLYRVYPTQANNSIPAGMPLPVNVAFPNGATPTLNTVAMPPPIPPARLFQPPDAYGAGQMQSKGYTGIYPGGTGNITPAVSNASDSGDPWINNLVATQALNPALVAPSYTLSNGFSGLSWSGGTYYPTGGNLPYLTPTGALPPISLAYPPYIITANPGTALTPLVLDNSINVNNGQPGPNSETPYLGSGNSDDRQHPYWRTELLQRAMNLTTVRTHQYAVWITVGFFEVKRQGDIAMLVQNLPQLAFDIMGPEVGALNGQNVRFRGFFLVDRLKLTGFNPTDVGAFHSAVVYRKVIQ